MSSLSSDRALKQLLNKNKEDKRMKVTDYINNLLNFYSDLSRFPISKLSFYENTMKIEARFKDQVTVRDYNVGFIINKACYVTGKRAIMNVRVLEEFLSPELDDCLITVKINKNSCELYAYNAFGRRILSGKIKFTTINLFGVDPKALDQTR